MPGKLSQIETASVDPAHVALAIGAGLLTVGIAAQTATPVAYVGAIFVAAGFFMGPAVPLGGVAGLIIHDLLRGAIGYSTLVAATWIIVFAGLIAWLTGPRPTAPELFGLRSIRRTPPTDIGLLVIAGIYATAFTAWLMMLVGWQRFYTVAFEYLSGVIVAVGVCVVVLVSAGAVRRLGLLADRSDSLNRSSFESKGPERGRSARRTGAAAVGALAIGVGWLGGVSALDVFVHDLGLFATASEFRAFVTGFLGTGSPIATVGTTLLVGLYRYGELVVLLSAPVAILALWGWDTYHGRICPTMVQRVETTDRKSTR